jgi:hypothetical protein
MIRRETDDAWLLISQVDHAHLAADLAAAWGNDHVPRLPLAEWLVPAIRDHDEGWRDWECTPTVTDGGRPRQFTEMPAAEATAIWSKSIAICADGVASSAEALRRLRAGGGEITPDDAAVLTAILRRRGSFGADELSSELVSEGDLTPEAIAVTLARMERAEVIAPLHTTLGGPSYALKLPSVGSAPLGGLWVSRHFTALAQAARENRADQPEECATLDAFLDEQAERQRAWSAAARDFAGDEWERVLDTGFRYVQFFDRLSLWLCMAEREEPWEASLSSSLTLRFTPQSTREMAVTPWPFAPPALELSVPALRLPAVPLASADELRSKLAALAPVRLRWVLTAG